MTPEVEKRLKEITVDVKTVQMAKPVSASTGPSTGLAGKWTMTLDAPGGTVPVELEVKQIGETLAGTVSSPHGSGVLQKIKVNGSSVTGEIVADIDGQQMEFQLDGKIEGGKFTGTLSNGGAAMPFTATRTN